MVGANNRVVEVFSYITLVLMILSILGATATLITFLIFPKLRHYPIKLIMYLCVTIIIGFVAFLIAFEPWLIANDGPCIVTAISVHIFFLANFFWTFCIAFNFYQMIVRRNREAKLLEPYYHVFCWGVPIIYAAFTGGFTQYGNVNDGVCYIKSALVRFLCFFIPGLVIISCNAVLFFFIGREIHETLACAPKSDQRDRKKELRVYLSIFISIGLSWIFGYLMFLLPFPIVTDIFFILFSIFTPLQGLFIFVFYCLNKKVAAAYAGLFGKCIPFCKTWEENWSTTSSGRSSRSGKSSRSSSGSSSSMSSSGA